MKQTVQSPRRLYKYRSFSDLTLDILVSDHLFYSDPSKFNDPLDSKPCLEADMPIAEMRVLLGRLVEDRVRSEMQAAAKTISYRGPRTIDHIDRHSKRRAEQLLEEIAYNARDPSLEMQDPELYILSQYVETELLRQYDKGIVSLAQRVTCPLMWSHYADQHNGLCIGYAVPQNANSALHKVEYGGSRFVRASRVAAMQAGDHSARLDVDDAVLLQKAGNWRYEREWRLIGPRGVQDCPLEMREIIFGIRCAEAVRYTIVKALEDSGRNLKFFEMREVWGTFQLKKAPLDVDELKHDFKRIKVEDWFTNVDGEEIQGGS